MPFPPNLPQMPSLPKLTETPVTNSSKFPSPPSPKDGIDHLGLGFPPPEGLDEGLEEGRDVYGGDRDMDVWRGGFDNELRVRNFGETGFFGLSWESKYMIYAKSCLRLHQ